MVSPGGIEDVKRRELLPAVDEDVEDALERRVEHRLRLEDAHDVAPVGQRDLVRKVGSAVPLLLVQSLDEHRTGVLGTLHCCSVSQRAFLCLLVEPLQRWQKR